MLKDCLENFIGLRGYCSESTPESGLYVNDLPSVSLKMINDVGNEEQKNFVGVWNEIYTRTLNQFESDVLIKAQKYFKTTLVAENSISGYNADPYEVESSSAEFKGIAIDANSRISKYLSIYVNSVQYIYHL